MTTNITTLALNLLISERADHRSIFADRITELLQENKEHSNKEQELKINFLTITAKCVEDTNCAERDLFYKLAQYYNQKINRFQCNISSAA